MDVSRLQNENEKRAEELFFLFIFVWSRRSEVELADPGSPYVATFQCKIYILFTSTTIAQTLTLYSR